LKLYFVWQRFWKPICPSNLSTIEQVEITNILPCQSRLQFQVYLLLGVVITTIGLGSPFRANGKIFPERHWCSFRLSVSGPKLAT
jgi:hypothetical protein